MKKTVVALLHIGYWFCYLILILVILGVLFGDDGAVSETKIEKAFHTLIYFILIPSAITFYLFYGVLFSKFLQQRKFVQTACYGLLTALASAIIGYYMLEWIIISKDGSCFGENDNAETRLSIILFIAFIATISGIIAFVIKGFITWVEEVKLKEELKHKNREMELALVKSQLDPHFLFNTINNIDVLILRDATQASDYLNKLSDIMRFMLFETKTEHILLSKEIEYINKYIELQKIRTANSSYVNFEVLGKVNGQLMAPMVFIPFIENAFKHTNNKKIPQAIDIKIETFVTHTQLICSNKFDPTRILQQQNHGLGNELIKRRLQLLYPDKHVLEVSNNQNVYCVALTIEHG
jgi:hypothetical protein